MNADGDHTEDTGPYAAEAPHHDVWRVARAWVENLFRMVDDLGHLARTGVVRAAGRRLGLFVFSIEAAVRRLVIMLALQITPPATKPKPGKPASRRAAGADTASRTRIAFRLFALRGHGGARPPAPVSMLPRVGPVFALTRDPLLALGAARPRTNKRQRGAACWRSLESPLALQMRRMMSSGPQADDNDLSNRIYFGARHKDRPRKPHGPPMLRQDRPALAARGLAHDQPIPAPGLARRIAALSNVIADPMAFAARAARRIARIGRLIETLRERPEPVPPSFKRDKRAPPALDLLQRSHALFAGAHDTS